MTFEDAIKSAILQARATIEKQTELIKEMRDVMKLNVDRIESLGYPAESLNYLVEKTRDYI